MIPEPVPVLRLASTPFTPDRRRTELDRLFAGPTDVHVVSFLADAEAVADTARELSARAVLADTYRGDLGELVAAVAPLPVLRPLFERRPGQHAGGPTMEFARYAQLDEHGQLVELDDGVLAEP